MTTITVKAAILFATHPFPGPPVPRMAGQNSGTIEFQPAYPTLVIVNDNTGQVIVDGQGMQSDVLVLSNNEPEPHWRSHRLLKAERKDGAADLSRVALFGQFPKPNVHTNELTKAFIFDLNEASSFTAKWALTQTAESMTSYTFEIHGDLYLYEQQGNAFVEYKVNGKKVSPENIEITNAAATQQADEGLQWPPKP